MKIKKIKWFTLIEVIIVVMILAILATISFISFRSYTGDARNANRAVDITNVWKWLSLYYAKTNKYPIPDEVYSTGVLNSKTASYLWYIGENVSRNVDLSKIPVDPFTWGKYLYAINFTKKQYQVAQSKEWQPGYFMDGNYKWILAAESVPSMIYLQTGSVDLTQSGVHYVLPDGILVGTGITKSYLCYDLTDAQVAKLNAMTNSFPPESRFWYDETTGNYYYVWDVLTKNDWCSITQLAITNTKNTSLPSEIGYLNAINNLTISDNQVLTMVPSTLSNLTNLQYLYIQNNPSLTNIIPSVSWMNHLWQLQISGSPLLGTIPTWIGALTQLQYLELRKIWISSIPATFWNLMNVSNLNLACNNLTGLPPELSKLKKLQNLDLGGWYDEVDCGLNAWLLSLAQYYDPWSEISQICEDIPGNFCIETNSSTEKIILSATPQHTCASQIIENANYTIWFPKADNTPWQNTDSNTECYYKCKIWFSGNDCLTVIPMTLFERFIAYSQETYLPIDPGLTFSNLTEYNWKLYFQDANSALYSIDSSSEVVKIKDYVSLKPFVFNNKLYIYWVDWNTELSYFTSIDDLGNTVDRVINIPRWYEYGKSPMTVFNNKLFFWWETSNGAGSELYYIDTSNTLSYININPTWSAITNINGMWYDLGVFNNKLYFWADWWGTIGTDLFSLDTSNNLVPINMNPSWDGVPWYNPWFQVFNNKLYFNVADNWVVWEELYYIDSSWWTGYIDINPWSADGNPHNFFIYNNKMYFKAMTWSAGWELFYIDSLEDVGYYDIHPGMWGYWWNYSNPSDLTIYNSKMYYKALLTWWIGYWFNLDLSGINTQMPWSDEYFWDILGVFDNKLYYLNYNIPIIEYNNTSSERNLLEWLNLIIWY